MTRSVGVCALIVSFKDELAFQYQRTKREPGKRTHRRDDVVGSHLGSQTESIQLRNPSDGYKNLRLSLLLSSRLKVPDPVLAGYRHHLGAIDAPPHHLLQPSL